MFDPYLVLSPLGETKKILDGTSPIAKWRRKIFEESEGMLSQ